MNAIINAASGPFKVLVVDEKGSFGNKLSFLRDSDNFLSVNFLNSVEDITFGKSAKNNSDFILLCTDGSVGDSISIIPWIKKKDPSKKVFVFTENYTYDTVRNAFLMGADGFIGKENCEQTIDNLLMQYMTNGEPAVSNDVVGTIINKMKAESLVFNNAKRLSTKQKAIAKLLVRGYTYTEISANLNQSIDLVRYHIKQIYHKLGIKSRMQLIPYVEAE